MVIRSRPNDPDDGPLFCEMCGDIIEKGKLCDDCMESRMV